MPDNYSGSGIACCSSSGLHIWKPQSDSGVYRNIAVPATSTPATAVAWNRNNKVVAVGRDDGSVQLCYSNGDAMSTLHRDQSPAALTGLSWSLGSKRLAAGSVNGRVYVHDMTTKTSKTLQGRAPVSAVKYHPDDKFLAVASDIVTLYNPQLERICSLCSITSSSPQTCLSVAAAEPLITAGSQSGTLALWDYKTQTLLDEHLPTHTSKLVGVQFAPLQSSLLVSAAADGSLRVWDRRQCDNAVYVETGTSLRCLAVKEDFSMFSVGTSGGVVLIYDARDATAPLHRLRCSGGHAVSSIHWQHDCQSLSMQTRVATPSESTANVTRRMSTAMMSASPGVHRQHTAAAAHTTTTAKTAGIRGGSEGGVYNRLPQHTDSHTRAAAAPTAVSSPASESLAVSLEQGNTPNNLKRNSLASPSGSDINSSPNFGNHYQQTTTTTTTAPELITTAAAAARTTPNARRTPTIIPPEPLPLDDDVLRVDSPLNPNEQRWAIPAVTPGLRARMAAEVEENAAARRLSQTTAAPGVGGVGGAGRNYLNDDTDVGFGAGGRHDGGQQQQHHQRHETTTARVNGGSGGVGRYSGGGNANSQTLDVVPTSYDEEQDSAAMLSSPKKTRLLPSLAHATAQPTTTTAPAEHQQQQRHSHPPQAVGPPQPTHGLREDVLALHLDMMQHFQEAQATNAAMMSALMERQDALGREMESLRGAIEGLLTRRDDVLWL